MNWTVQMADDGTFSLQQISPPDFATFEQHIMHTDMTDRDIVHFVAEHGYIMANQAFRIAGQNPATPPPRINVANIAATLPADLLQALGPPQQGLLAANPSLSPSLHHALMTNPTSLATSLMGFNVDEVLQAADSSATRPAYQWTGSMSDLYHPDAGSVDLSSITGHPNHNTWELTNLDDPQSCDRYLADAVQGGYYTPNGKQFRSN